MRSSSSRWASQIIPIRINLHVIHVAFFVSRTVSNIWDTRPRWPSSSSRKGKVIFKSLTFCVSFFLFHSVSHFLFSLRINHRYFAKDGRGGYKNPPPGTVIDHTITKRDWYDFLLVSQHVTQASTSLTVAFHSRHSAFIRVPTTHTQCLTDS
jgi:Piwi domain